ncbi:hypothetical protein ADIMK_2552 [Marinobacterium lacunae]|uniref:Peptidase A2 domain-containing protein n=1 Tax=Marinobacterium lacunae TaxID=1232683 RepID=A0A081FWX3_9GAMM|nr:retropepsin-like aspartic protease [Marinobacterium lacunae]KEA63028.1 hypothetical protein ADIMK_2552 [Marinobacterium lacunae]
MTKYPLAAILLCVAVAPLSPNTQGAEAGTRVALKEGAATTFYIQASVGGLAPMAFMVDTGSGFTTINEQTLVDLQRQDLATYKQDLIGILANGSEIRVPVYTLSSLEVGGCRLAQVDAAVFPGTDRQILGLSALRQVGAFTFSFDPPELLLKQCPQTGLLSADAE